MSTEIKTNILVIGAGPGGTATAWGLVQRGYDVLLIDAAQFPRDKTCGDGLTPLAVKNLHQMGVLSSIENSGAVRLDHVRITGPLGIVATMQFDHYQQSEPYALVMPRFKLDNLLLDHAIQSGVKFMGGMRVKHINREQDRITSVEATSNGETTVIHAQHVVIAVGANMGFLRREGFLPYQPKPIRAARAYYANVHAPLKVYDFFFDIQLMPGYGWIFPTGEGTANIGIGHLPVFWANHLKQQSTAKLLDGFIERRIREGLISNVERIGPIKGYPLRTDFPRQCVAGSNWVIVGEAAGLVNPVTGEGIDLAIESGLLAAKMLDYVVQHKKANHAAYQHALWERFGPMFNGLRILQNILVTPIFADYAMLLMNQHRFTTSMLLKIAQGLKSPEYILHPMVLLQFFIPLTPRFAWEQVNAAFKDNQSKQGQS